MANSRLIVGIFVGIFLSIFSIGAFSQWTTLNEIHNYFGGDLLKFFYVLFTDNFRFDIFSFFTSSNLTIFDFLAPAMLSWLFVGFVCGSIVKGSKRGFTIAVLVVIIDLLIWIIIGIIAGEDVFNLFIDTNLITTLGGIFSAFMGGIVGGVIGGAVSGPYEGM